MINGEIQYKNKHSQRARNLKLKPMKWTNFALLPFEQLCTCPSPNPTTVNLWYVRIHFGLGEGWVYSRLDTVIDLYFLRSWLDVLMTLVSDFRLSTKRHFKTCCFHGTLPATASCWSSSLTRWTRTECSTLKDQTSFSPAPRRGRNKDQTAASPKVLAKVERQQEKNF